jgi:hypothetical protein
MSQSAGLATTMATFVVRFWREISAGEARWRGQIEHVQSRDSVSFSDLEAMLQFMHGFGIAGGKEPREHRPVARPVHEAERPGSSAQGTATASSGEEVHGIS